MSVYGFVKIGFQKNPKANNKVRQALMGTIKVGESQAPFQRKNTGLFVAEGADNAEVVSALGKLLFVLAEAAATIDMVSITLTHATEDDIDTELDETDEDPV